MPAPFVVTLHTPYWIWNVQANKTLPEDCLSGLMNTVKNWKTGFPKLNHILVTRLSSAPDPKKWRYKWTTSDLVPRQWVQELWIPDNNGPMLVNFKSQDFFTVEEFAPARAVRDDHIRSLIYVYDLESLDVTWV